MIGINKTKHNNPHLSHTVVEWKYIEEVAFENGRSVMLK